MSQAIAIKTNPIKQAAHAIGEFLYGDDEKTRRTFALCILAIALGKVLDTAPSMAACGI